MKEGDERLTKREKIILFLASAGLVISSMLVLNEIEFHGYSPSLGIIPSCYIFADSFVLVILSVLLINKFLKNILFVSGITLGSSVSLYFSVVHYTMINPSPSLLDIPVNYIFFIIFSLLIITKYIVIKETI